jgi:hypothetical protein
MDTNINILLPVLEKIWNEENVPKEWKEGLIMKIPKKKKKKELLPTEITDEVLLC